MSFGIAILTSTVRFETSVAMLGSDFRDILIHKFEERSQRNPAYSMRAFARDINVSAAHLSQVFRGREGLSRKKALQIADKIFDSPEDIQHFCDLVESQHSRSWAGKEAAARALSSFWKTNRAEISVEDFALISEWYHVAILHMVDLADFKADPDWIAGRLGISSEMAQEAIDHLVDLELLTEGPEGLHKNSNILLHSDRTPIPLIRKYHEQILQKTQKAIHEQEMDERFLTSMTFAVPHDRLNLIRDHIRAFLTDISRISMTGEAPKDQLYAVNVQLINLMKREND